MFIKAPTNSEFLSARHNPLSIDRVSSLAFLFKTGEWTEHLEKLKKLNYRAAIVGIQGSGKTTLLRNLDKQLCNLEIKTHLLFVPRSTENQSRLLNNALEKSRNGAILLIDGIERLGLLKRMSLLNKTRSAEGLIITSHLTCRLPTWIHCRTNPALMANVLTKLCLDHEEVQTAGAIAFEKSAGNIRLALFDLYDQFASGRFNKILSR